MNDKRKPFFERAEAFFAGKGFYIVLFLCVTVIGVSAWSLLTGGGKTQQDRDVGVAAANMEPGLTVIADAAPTPRVTPLPTSAPTPAPTPAPQPPEKTETPAPARTPAPAAEVRDYYIWPTAGPIENGYSMAALTFSRTMQDWRAHDGVDIAAELGAQVKAMTNGEVTQVYDDDLYGTTVVIRHRGGLESIYANLAAAPTVAVGDQVVVGQVIGSVGDTALCETGEVCHLHLAMTKDGESVDPTDYLPK